MINAQKQTELIEKILRSQTFQSSQINKELLQYLYQKTCSNETPKEIDIATDLLNAGKDFDPAIDTSVRSRIYKLRQKLIAYYQNEGASDEYRLIIPKGSYRVEFTKSNNNVFRKNRIIWITLIILFISLLVHGYFFLSQNEIKNHRFQAVGEHPFWSSFIDNDLSTFFVVGDFFTFVEDHPDNGSERVIRDYNINSEEDFNAYIKQYPHHHARKNENYRSIAWTAVENVLKVSGLFYTNHSSILAKRASRLTWEDVRNHHIFFEGHPRSLFILNRVLKMTHLDISLDVPFNIFVTSNHIDSLQVFRANRISDVITSYVILAKLPGPSDNSIFLCITHDEMPRTYVIEQLTHLDFLKELDTIFIDKLIHIPEYFEMVLRVDGFPRTGINHQVVYVAEVKSSGLEK